MGEYKTHRCALLIGIPEIDQGYTRHARFKCQFEHIITIGSTTTEYQNIENIDKYKLDDDDNNETDNKTIKHMNIPRRMNSELALIQIMKYLQNLNYGYL